MLNDEELEVLVTITGALPRAGHDACIDSVGTEFNSTKPSPPHLQHASPFILRRDVVASK